MPAEFHMWVVFALSIGVIVLYMTEWVSLELTSLGLIATLLVFFHLFPLPLEGGQGGLFGPVELLHGFANPALITVLALLVVGEGLVQTGALDRLATWATHPSLGELGALALTLAGVLAFSAFLNNTPIVVIFIPILRYMAQRFDAPASRVMIPLSYAAILGGMTTLIGSSTNLLVSGSMMEMGLDRLGFFEFSAFGVVLAIIGLAYVVLILPRLMPHRANLASKETAHGRQYIAQISVPEGSALVGKSTVAGQFKDLPGLTIRMIQRGENAVLPPFDEVVLAPRDLIVVAGTRKSLTEAINAHPGLFHPPRNAGNDTAKDRMAKAAELSSAEENETDEQLLVEVMITPNSRLIGLNLRQMAFRRRFRGVVLGVQRRARMIRAQMTEIRLESGDVLIVQTHPNDVEVLRGNRDMVVLSGSKTALLKTHHSKRAGAVFLGAVGLAALGVIPIVVAAVLAATILIAMGAMNIRQAARAVDRKVVMVVGAAIALGGSLQVTGGAQFLAQSLVMAIGEASPQVLLSVLFITVAVLTNILSNNACAVLFTPVAINMALEAGADPRIFAITVLFAANCSFASPVGYQTNLLVMGPGSYQFSDFVRGGAPLMILLWLAFTFLAPMFWSL